MKQVLHIFRKDTRQYWLEILASLVVLSLYAWLAPGRWNYSETAMRNQAMNLLLPVLLVPVTWWLLIARVIHAENLVGDRQWWLTRPYEWKKLLGAKALFVAVWIYVPFVIAQAAILKEAGFSPFMQPAGWLYMLAMVSGYLLLPLVAIATVTTNFARMTLTLLAVTVTGIAAVRLALTPRSRYESNLPYDHSLLFVLMLIAGAAIAVFLQYATRRVWPARAALIATVALTTCTGMTLTAMRQSEIDREYPAGPSSPVQLALATGAGGGTATYMGTVTYGTVTYSERQEKVYINVPLVFSGVAPDSAVEVDDVKIALEDPATGLSWTAPWWASLTLRFLPGQHQSNVQIMVDREQYERFKSAPVTLHLTLAVTELHTAGETTAAISTTTDFPVSGFGICSGRWMYRFPSQLMCRSALGEPPLTWVSTVWSAAPDRTQPMPSGPITGASWTGTAYGNTQMFGPMPVWLELVNVYPSSGSGPLGSTHGLALPPGTPVHFTQYAVTRRTRVSLTIPNFRLPDEPR